MRLVLENTRFEKMAKIGHFQGFQGFYGPFSVQVPLNLVCKLVSIGMMGKQSLKGLS